MTDLLKEILYREEESGSLKYWDLPGYRQAEDQLNIYRDMVEKTLGSSVAEELSATEHSIHTMETLAAFRHGFQLAGRLLLELFTSRP